MASDKLSRAQLEDVLSNGAPFAAHYGFIVEEYAPGSARVRLPYDERHTRPGGTISGPSMFALADFSLYIAVMAAIGPVALAVTTNMTIDFLRKPAERDLIADVQLLKLGKRLAVGRVDLRGEGDDFLCAHVTGTYSIPPMP